MSVVDDTRKLLQDIVSPDLKALTARVEALERSMKDSFTDVNRRFDSAEALASVRHRALMDLLDLNRRVALIENKIEKVN